MPVTLLSAVDPFPTDAGKKVVLAGFIDYLVDRRGPDNVHYLLVGGQARPNFPVKMHSLPKPSRRAALGAVLTRAGTGRATLQESLLTSRPLDRAVRETLDRIGPSLEIYDTIRMAQYADPARSGHQICYLDDLFSERYQGMLAAGDRYPDVEMRPLGNFAEHVPTSLRPLADSRRPQRALLRLESELARRSENRAAQRFSRSLLVNQGEADRLTRRVANKPCGDVAAVPPLIAPPEYRLRQYRGAPEFLFVGLLALPHNDDGVRSFLAEVWPDVLLRAPGAKLRIIGKGASPGLAQLVRSLEGSVTIEGYVEDLTEALSTAAALVNHLRFGSGIKLKVIEALGRGLPVVSTAVGADGFAAGADRGVLVAEDASSFADAMLELTDPAYNRAVSDGARAHFADTFSREAVFACYDAAFALG